MLIVRRCRYCPSAQLHGSRLRPIDLPLLCLAIRRQRCEFCDKLQWTWLLPRPLRWALAVVLLGVVYVGSAGPVKWLHDNYRMSDTTYERLNRWVYRPLNLCVDSPQWQDSLLVSTFIAYRNWWAPPSESLRLNDARPVDLPASDEPSGVGPDKAQASLREFADHLEHRTLRPTGEPQQQ